MHKYAYFVQIIAIVIILTTLLYLLSWLLLKYENQQVNISVNTNNNSTLKIFFATQTGTAENLANKLSEVIQKCLRIEIVVVDLDNFEFDELLHTNIAIFIVSTCGDGEITDNSRFFVSWLENIHENSLVNLNYSLFGLGSHEYEHFNAASKLFHRILTKLGASLLSPVVYGNSQFDIDPDFHRWIKELIPRLALHYDIKYYEPLELSNSSVYKSWRDVKGVENELVYLTSDTVSSGVKVDINNLSLVCRRQAKCVKTLIVSKRFLIENDVCHIDLANPFKLEPADNIAVLYRTSDKVLDWWVKRLNINSQDLDKTITFKPIDSTRTKIVPPFLVPCTLYDALTLYCDLTALPQESELLNFTAFLTDEHEIKIMTSILNNKKIFNLMEKDVKMTLIEFVELFMSSAVFDLSGFLQLIPKKNLRQYTISSSPLYDLSFSITVKKTWERLHPLKKFLKRLEIKGLIPKSLLTKLDDVKSRPREYKGACSNYLVDLESGSEVYVSHMPSKFNIDLRNPMIMIATGTGIAPFRSFWEHLTLLNIRNENSVLFYGCRNKDEWLYRDEINSIVHGGNSVIGKLFLAFSREKNEKVYVQHKILEERCLILKHLFENQGKIFVCGNREMGKCVKGALISIINDHTGVANGAACLDGMVKNGTFVYEVWT
ncbi:NADPH-ferrihemoprotein reductase [Babesia microti strain RI]|uniref:NADPH--hemoprotein reductase n=1 Tax=Babesia microti (strain RI) TaxID=1133968 RepID=A0A1R4AAU2_BABMR|nr:NADPH-ferrihemoprotein reductase [Babesia microti strain RI]SJK86122.1 NADPH-ferrihemoprotein reductase [Babesia microti strain RI]|eukprot:XP_021338316.1 NADPH-ferrihemoprotein reductase [Babesia microti strain RI]